ncbi:MAG: polysaccharide biosynthesis tyrosine autokinase [Flavobacteriaceae bacterium]|nr:polysaccharide biosynthesis tyrosine autokinase [Flavobacteriaceae bacterium]
MENNQGQQEFIDGKENAEDIKRLLLRYLSYWPYFILSVFILTGVAYLYLRSTPPVYQTTSKIKVLKDEGAIDMSGFQGSSPLIDMTKVNLENESEILKSRRLTSNVIKNLGLQTSVYLKGNIRTVELWKDEIPFEIIWENKDLDKLTTNQYEINFSSTEKFSIEDTETSFKKEYSLGELITHEEAKFRVLIKDGVETNKYLNKTFFFAHKPLELLITSITSKINVENIGQRSEILNIFLNGQNKQKNEDIINNLIYQFNFDGIEDNKKLARKTEKFVVERLKFLNQELDTVESSLVDFKTESGLITVETSAQELFGKNTAAEAMFFEVSQQLLLVEDFQREIDEMDDFELLPANIGISDNGVNQFTTDYNKLIMERAELLVSSTDESIQIREINKQLNQVKQNIIRTLASFKRQLELRLEKIEKRESSTKGRINLLPSQEKEINEIARQQLVKQRLYVFLLQKREEATLSAAVASDIIKVVDFAYTNPNPVSPKPKIIMLGSILLGLIIPFGIVYIKFLLDTKVYTKEDIKLGIGEIPIVGEIPFEKEYQNKVLSSSDHSALAESFRILKTNLKFLGKTYHFEEKNKSKVIFITSTMKGEGKTFTSVNLASILATNNKKVVLIGSDLRNPQIHNFLGLNKATRGLSYFLYENDAKVSDITIKGENIKTKFDVILSGEIPPNPSELLSNGRFEVLIEQLKEQYDYILVDSAPTILVTDSLLIAENADFSLYMIRSGHTDTQLLEHIREIYKKKKLKNMGIVFNGLKDNGAYAYNYGYGYGYNEKAKSRNRLRFW